MAWVGVTDLCMLDDKALRKCETQQMGSLQNNLRGHQAEHHPLNLCSLSSCQRNKRAYKTRITKPDDVTALTVWCGENSGIFSHFHSAWPFLMPLPWSWRVGGQGPMDQADAWKENQVKEWNMHKGIVASTKSLKPCADVLLPRQQVAQSLHAH